MSERVPILEPAANLDALVSIAISLKRIADALEPKPKAPPLTIEERRALRDRWRGSFDAR